MKIYNVMMTTLEVIAFILFVGALIMLDYALWTKNVFLCILVIIIEIIGGLAIAGIWLDK